MAALADGDDIDVREYFGVIVKRWQVIVVLMIVFAVGAFVYSRQQKPVYEATTVVMIRGSSSSASSQSQYAGMAALMGVNLTTGGGDIGDMMRLIRSKAVAARVLDNLKLSERIKGWDNPEMKRSDLVSAVSGMLKTPEHNGNIIEVKAEANEPQLAADVANAFVDALSYYLNLLSSTDAQRKLKYLESELPRIEANLMKDEAILALGGYKQAGLNGLQRDFEINNSVYVMLRKERESAKLEVAKDLPIFTVIDPALKPLSPSRPKTKSHVKIGLGLGLFMGLVTAFFQEYLDKANKNA